MATNYPHITITGGLSPKPLTKPPPPMPTGNSKHFYKITRKDWKRIREKLGITDRTRVNYSVWYFNYQGGNDPVYKLHKPPPKTKFAQVLFGNDFLEREFPDIIMKNKLKDTQDS